jgi:hypothetical protein
MVGPVLTGLVSSASALEEDSPLESLCPPDIGRLCPVVFAFDSGLAAGFADVEAAGCAGTGLVTSGGCGG